MYLILFIVLTSTYGIMTVISGMIQMRLNQITYKAARGMVIAGCLIVIPGCLLALTGSFMFVFVVLGLIFLHLLVIANSIHRGRSINSQHQVIRFTISALIIILFILS